MHISTPASGLYFIRDCIPNVLISIGGCNGGLKDTCLVIIYIEDINDNAPTFNATRYTFTTTVFTGNDEFTFITIILMFTSVLRDGEPLSSAITLKVNNYSRSNISI
jgi:hypothetical protein